MDSNVDVSSFLRWSHDGKYFGQMAENLLRIYETPVSDYTAVCYLEALLFSLL